MGAIYYDGQGAKEESVKWLKCYEYDLNITFLYVILFIYKSLRYTFYAFIDSVYLMVTNIQESVKVLNPSDRRNQKTRLFTYITYMRE